MPTPLIQTSFMGGELSKNLYGMVDLQKYKSAAALLRNYFADYRGGASSRFGSRFCAPARDSRFPVRLIPFIASFTVSYTMEFGHGYIRFFTNGGPVLEASFPVTATSGNTFTSTATYVAGDMVFYNNQYYIVTNNASPYTVTDMFGFIPTLTGTGTVARIYTIATPYNGNDLALVKFAQNVQFMVFTHNNYPPQLLTYNGPTNWTFAPIVFGASVGSPTIISVTFPNIGSTGLFSYYLFAVTAVDKNGQESPAGTFSVLGPYIGLGVYNNAGPFSALIQWTPVPGAISYNVYRAGPAAAPVPPGTYTGLVGSTSATSFTDSGNANGQQPDFQITPPIPKNPFLGGPIVGATVTTPGTYTTVPTVHFPAPSATGQTAIGTAVLGLQSFSFTAGTGGHSVGGLVLFQQGVALIISSVDGTGVITGFQPLTFPGSSRGAFTGGGVLGGTAPTTLNDLSGTNAFAQLTSCVWGVVSVDVTTGGTEYVTPPPINITFNPAGAVATAVVDTPPGGNPAVPCFIQQRLALASKVATPQTIDFSQPGAPYNNDISLPLQPDDAITINLVSKQLNTIVSMIPMPAGLVVLTQSSAWLINGSGGSGSPITAISIVAQSQAYNGANHVPPIVANDDVLYVQAKGAIVRDLRFNFYTAVYTGIDVSVLAEHLFFGFQILEWCWSEEPFKIVWAVRNDGLLLSMTFSKEQEIVGWCHHDTQGLYKSICTVPEQTSNGAVDATYQVVERVVQGETLKYIERMADRFMPNGIQDAWCLDSAVQGTFGTPQTTVSGLTHLNGMVVSALVDGQVVNGLTVSNGSVTLPFAGLKILVGLTYLPQLQTLPVEAGQPTIQGKQKRTGPLVFKVRETRGMSVGRTFGTLVDVKDSGPPMLNPFPGMYSDPKDIWMQIDALYDDYGQVCFQQNNPWPVSILAVIPWLEVGK